MISVYCTLPIETAKRTLYGESEALAGTRTRYIEQPLATPKEMSTNPLSPPDQIPRNPVEPWWIKKKS